MADPSAPNRHSATEVNDGDRLKHAFDAGFFSGAHTPLEDSDDVNSTEAEGELAPSADIARSFRLFSESMLRIELAEMEMTKAREASRLRAERRRAETEVELTRMLAQTQLQMATAIAGRSGSRRKRKRTEEEDTSSASTRDGALLLSLLQCNLFF